MEDVVSFEALGKALRDIANRVDAVRLSLQADQDRQRTRLDGVCRDLDRLIANVGGGQNWSE